ncbi:hypothetical protein J437_LFUL008147 [Ladona fulva]|uniref:Uncharacterized protein n=1 Tax=Ladona fulva TaxID=123851 RepID=A0A8K0JV08_LADFU|nr:hypothetical protein J437_LFUL008147 [Ladona fulva]
MKMTPLAVSLFCGFLFGLITFSTASQTNDASIHPTQVHKHMTFDELRSVFHVDHHDKDLDILEIYNLYYIRGKARENRVIKGPRSFHSSGVPTCEREFEKNKTQCRRSYGREPLCAPGGLRKALPPQPKTQRRPILGRGAQDVDRTRQRKQCGRG